MGSQVCAGVREKIDHSKQSGAEMYSRAKTKAKDKLHEGKLKQKGYELNKFEDNGQTQPITDFENSLSLHRVPLDTIDTLVREFQEKEKVQKLTVAQLVQLLKNVPYLQDIEDEKSLTRKVLTHKVIESTAGIIYIPYLKLLAILLCASKKKQKAEVFCALFKKDDSNIIAKNDVLLVEYVEKLQEISYTMMIKMHAIHHPEQSKMQWILPEWMDDIYNDIYKDFFMETMFGRELDKIECSVFVMKLENDIPYFLKSYELRQQVFAQVLQIVFKQMIANRVKK